MMISTLLSSPVINAVPLLGAPPQRDLFLNILEQVRQRFLVVGYVVMPEHVHLVISEPEASSPSVVMQAVKQEFAKNLMRSIRARTDLRQSQLWADAHNPKHVWQTRF
jgi:REP element-mobilizing transposase RayT